MRFLAVPALLLALLCTGCSLLINPGDNSRDPGAGQDGGADGDCVDQEITIAMDSDDGEVFGGDVWKQGEDWEGSVPAIYMGSWSTTYAWGFFRFAMPTDYTETHLAGSVRLKLWGAETLGWNESMDSLEILLEDTSQADEVTHHEQAPGGFMASSTIAPLASWPPGDNDVGLVWNLGEYNESPDLSEMFRQLVAEHGFVPRRHVQLWVRGAIVDRQAEVGASDFGQGNPAKLRFECP